MKYIKQIVQIIQNRVIDYRYKVNKNAKICFAYYLVMSIIPICSICTFIATIFKIDLNTMEQILMRYLTPEFSRVIIESLKPSQISMSTIIVIGISLVVVSRGINQLYDISKIMFPSKHKRSFIIERLLMVVKTAVVFMLLLIIISLLTLIPVISSITAFGKSIVLDDFYLYIIFFVMLFLLYKIIPDVHVCVLDIAIGAGVAALLMLLLLTGLEFYFSIADYTSVYGPLASVVVIMISFTFIAEMIYIGMYIMFEAHMKRLVDKLNKNSDDK